MPFVSQAQRRYLYAKHPAVAREFAAKTPKGKKLPQHVKHKSKKKNLYTVATNGLQGIGKRIGSGIRQARQTRKMADQNFSNRADNSHYYEGTKYWATHKNKAKPKFKVNNKMKSLGRMNTKTNVIEINKKKHKGDKKELADTIKHELTHVKHPKMKEKQVYKSTDNMTSSERSRMLSKLKGIHYKQGALKRKYKIGRKGTQPGDFIRESRRVARDGLV